MLNKQDIPLYVSIFLFSVLYFAMLGTKGLIFLPFLLIPLWLYRRNKQMQEDDPADWWKKGKRPFDEA